MIECRPQAKMTGKNVAVKNVNRCKCDDFKIREFQDYS